MYDVKQALKRSTCWLLWWTESEVVIWYERFNFLQRWIFGHCPCFYNTCNILISNSFASVRFSSGKIYKITDILITVQLNWTQQSSSNIKPNSKYCSFCYPNFQRCGATTKTEHDSLILFPNSPTNIVFTLFIWRLMDILCCYSSINLKLLDFSNFLKIPLFGHLNNVCQQIIAAGCNHI